MSAPVSIGQCCYNSKQL